MEINPFAAVLNGLVDIKPEPGESDYTKDGLIYCGECEQPKQMRLDILGELKTVTVMCQCQKTARAQREAEDKTRKQIYRRERMKAEGLSEAAWQVSFADDDKRDKQASTKCKNYTDNFDAMAAENVGLLLYGGLGSGKTFLAGCIANTLIDQDYSVMMASLPTLIARINADYGEQKELLLGRIERYDLIVLDDVGVERNTEFSIEQTFEIINARYKANKPLIITTNLKPSDLTNETNLDRRRIYDRIVEMCQPLLVKGESRRQGISGEKRAAALKLLEGE